MDYAPEDPGIWTDYSICLLEQGRFAESLSILNEGIKHHPDVSKLRYLLVSALYFAGYRQDALQALVNALELNYQEHLQLFEFYPALAIDKDITNTIAVYGNGRKTPKNNG